MTLCLAPRGLILFSALLMTALVGAPADCELTVMTYNLRFASDTPPFTVAPRTYPGLPGPEFVLHPGDGGRSPQPAHW